MAFKIAIDAGHYMGTPGKRLDKKLDPAQTREWVLNDRVARAFAAAAAQYKDVETFRVDDPTGKTEVSLEDRCKKANDLGANLYFSAHHNAGAELTKAGGLVAYSRREGTVSAEYRDAIYDECIANGGIKGNRATPKTTAGFWVLKYTNMPSVLIEYGFMDSKIDYKIILDEKFSKRQGEATMAAIAKVAGLKRKDVQETPSRKKTVAEIAAEVIAGKWGTGADRKRQLVSAGYNYTEVQAKVNVLLKAQVPAEPKASVAEIAAEVIAGKWGTGTDRKNRLTKAGYNYDEVQAKVNELLKPPAKPKLSITEVAKEVIAGKWGTGSDRKDRLTKAGYDAAAVQAKVNELLK